VHALREALDRLRSPYVTEELSVLVGERLFAVDLDPSANALDAEALDQATHSLARLPCPTVAFCSADDLAGAAEQLAPAFDLFLSSREGLAPLEQAVEQTPLACLALVQLLRQGEWLDIHHGLVSESLVYSVLQSGPEFGAWRAERAAPRERRENPAPAVRVNRTGPRLVITLNRPEKHNAFSAEMRDALAEALRVAIADPDLAEIELRGAGRSFCSGGDLDEFGTFPDPATAHAIRSTRNPGRLLSSCADRVSAYLHGACVGAGIELPAFVRRVVAHPDAFFQLPEVAFGLVPGAGGTVSLPRRIGRQRTAWLALTGERLDSETALAWGLVDEISEEAG
jgi:enoyl-CoA hydratase/carnithine racemase